MANPELTLREFHKRYHEIGLFSTGAKEVDYKGVLYNITGSSRDPRIGDSWKQLLLSSGINGNCYVTNPPAEGGTSHPNFNVGGHMTPSPLGYAKPGGICYLMPLCKWHNSTARDKTPFEHYETRMLELSGYLEGELAATFEARMPGDAEYRLVSVKGDALISQAIDAPLLNLMNVHRDTGVADPALPQTYLLFRQVKKGDSVRFVIDDARLPIIF